MEPRRSEEHYNLPQLIDAAGLAELHAALRRAGYLVIGPTVRDGAIVLAELASAADLPYGWGVALEPTEPAPAEPSDPPDAPGSISSVSARSKPGPACGPVPIEVQKQVSPGSVQFTAIMNASERRLA